MYVHSDVVPDESREYLTPRKRYPVSRYDGDGGWIANDNGYVMYALFSHSAHLDNAAWIVTHD